MKKTNVKKQVKNYILIALGSVLYAVAISMFLNPNQLAPGGVAGLAIIVNFLTDLPTGTVILAINIPLMLLGTWKLGFKMMLGTIFSTVFSSFIIDRLSLLQPVTTDPLLASVAGGAIMAMGMALVFKGGATTGGSDIIVRLVKLKYKHLKTGKIFLMSDSTVVALSAIVFGNINIAMYAAIAIFVFSIVFDNMLYGTDSAKLVYVITSEEQPIAARLMDLDIGVTYLKGIGAFTGQNKKVILCAMKKQIFPQVHDIIKDEDPDAFLIVTSANEIFGESFKDHFEQQL